MISSRRFIYVAILAMSCLIAAGGSALKAQSVLLVEATSQGWAGGVCCRHGENFNIHLKILHGKTPVVLDSMWLNGYCFSLKEYNTTTKNQEKISVINITQNIIIDDHLEIMNNKCFDSLKTGVSFTYYINQRKKSMDITPYMKVLEYIAYP